MHLATLGTVHAARPHNVCMPCGRTMYVCRACSGLYVSAGYMPLPRLLLLLLLAAAVPIVPICCKLLSFAVEQAACIVWKITPGPLSPVMIYHTPPPSQKRNISQGVSRESWSRKKKRPKPESSPKSDL